MMLLSPRSLLLGALVLAASCSTAGTPATAPAPRRDPNVLPQIDREFRGLWVATVNNIDWPSRPGLTADSQRTELVTLLARAKAAGMNAIIFHARPAADAVYRSPYEPWGAMLTGRQGGDPGWDPLAVAVAEAHRRGMELHAWINPFRAGDARDTALLAPNHVFHERRDLLRIYGTQLWFDPGEPAVHDRSMRAILDIVNRYDVDGVHLDDYFYPYPVNDSAKVLLPFPDSATYARYGNGMTLGDWRRDNVNRFVERLYKEVHAAKPTVRVGISPFGIWRPGNPPQVTGLDSYDAIYADSRTWLQRGWVDYFVPQLYWRIDPPQQSFTALLDWWLAQSTSGRPVWPGLATYRVYSASNPYPLTEMSDQVAATRARAASGLVFYNTTSTLSRGNGEIAAMLRRDFFADAALPPAAPWLGGTAPNPPTIGVNGATVTITPTGAAPRWWAIRWRAANVWSTTVAFGAERSITLAPANAPVDWVVVNAVSAADALSADVTWRAP